MTRTRHIAGPIVLAAAGLLAPWPEHGAAAATGRTLRVGRDADSLAATIALAASGDVVDVPEGTWHGPVTLDRAITLRGRGGVIDGGGHGSVLTVSAPKAVVEDLTFRNSGDDLGESDACIFVAKAATGAVVRGNTVEACAFGIWVHETHGAHIEDNRVVGSETGHRSNRGNGIHLFNAERLEVTGNEVTGGRDGVYVSATEDSLIAGNRVERTRYGVHYMFSYRNTVRDNVCVNNGSGYALMSSQHLHVSGNRAEKNDEHGLLFRDVQYTDIRDNHLRDNGEGLFFYSSTENVIEDNHVLHNETGAKIWAGSVRNRVSGNVFLGNRRQVFYVGTSDLVWGEDAPGNAWGDYLGWDQDGDGLGDRPYRVDSFSTNLVYRYPAAVLLLRSPSLELLSHLERQLPMLRVPTVVDARPKIGGAS